MSKCEAGFYTDNDVVIHSPLVCFGGFGQPKCNFLEKCLKDNGYEIKIAKSGKKRVKKIKVDDVEKKGAV